MHHEVFGKEAERLRPGDKNIMWTATETQTWACKHDRGRHRPEPNAAAILQHRSYGCRRNCTGAMIHMIMELRADGGTHGWMVRWMADCMSPGRAATYELVTGADELAGQVFCKKKKKSMGPVMILPIDCLKMKWSLKHAGFDRYGLWRSLFANFQFNVWRSPLRRDAVAGTGLWIEKHHQAVNGLLDIKTFFSAVVWR